MSMSEEFSKLQDEINKRRSAEVDHNLQIQFERLTVFIIGDAEEIAQIDKLTNLEVGPVELTSINNAITKLQAFVLKHRRKVAA